MDEGLRLTDILTTASAVANFLGARDVDASHLLTAIELLQGTKTLDDLGRPLSPLVSRMTGAGSGATDEVKQLAQRWFTRQDGDVMYEFSSEDLAAFRAEVELLAGQPAGS